MAKVKSNLTRNITSAHFKGESGVKPEFTYDQIQDELQTQVFSPPVTNDYIQDHIMQTNHISKKYSSHSINTATTKPNTVMHFNQNGIHTTQFGRYPIDSADISSSHTIANNSVRNMSNSVRQQP